MKARKAQPMMPGYDGAIEIDTETRISGERSKFNLLRCRPGSFEWRYGRKTADAALYHAGIKFAELWEFAGTASASSPDLGAIGGGMWRGIQNGRLEAMDKIDAARDSIGAVGTALLVDYLVMGSTASEMGPKYSIDGRSMAIILDHHLHSCANHFRHL